SDLSRDVLPLLNQLRTRSFDQIIGAERIPGGNVSWDCKHFPILFHRQTSRYQRSRIFRSFHHKYAQAQTANDAIAVGKVFRNGWGAQWKLANERAATFQYLAGESFMIARINFVNPSSQHRHGSTATFKCTSVRRCINSASETRNNRHSTLSQIP